MTKLIALPLLVLLALGTGCAASPKPMVRATPELPSAGPMPSEAPPPGPPKSPSNAFAGIAAQISFF